jgi:polyisoprenoid-binding protein YceI
MPSTSNREIPKSTPDTQALNGRWSVDPQASYVRFVAATLAGLLTTPGQFRSISGSLVVDDARAAGALLIDSASIDTGNRLRDRHLRSRDFFDAERHPHLHYEAHSISGRGLGEQRVDGELIVAKARVPMPLEVTFHAPSEGVLALVCRTDVDRMALGISGARGIVPRSVELNVAITLRRQVA